VRPLNSRTATKVVGGGGDLIPAKKIKFWRLRVNYEIGKKKKKVG